MGFMLQLRINPALRLLLLELLACLACLLLVYHGSLLRRRSRDRLMRFLGVSCAGHLLDQSLGILCTNVVVALVTLVLMRLLKIGWNRQLLPLLVIFWLVVLASELAVAAGHVIYMHYGRQSDVALARR